VLSKIGCSARYRSHKSLTTIEMVFNVAILPEAVCGGRKASWLALLSRLDHDQSVILAGRPGDVRELVEMCVESGGLPIAAHYN
jgi:hypothetical protein